jgi:hypothetical protein
MLKQLKKHQSPLISSNKRSSKKAIPSTSTLELGESGSQSSSSISANNGKAPIAVLIIKAVMSSTVDTKTPSEIEAESLLVDIRHSRDDLLLRVAYLEKDIQEQMALGVAHQMMGGCSDDTERYFQKANSLKQKRELILTAIDVLDMHILTLESEIKEAQAARRSVDFCEQEYFAQEMASILRSM